MGVRLDALQARRCRWSWIDALANNKENGMKINAETGCAAALWLYVRAFGTLFSMYNQYVRSGV